MSHPQARRFDHVRELDGELVIVDDVNDVAHRLTAPTARVWRACDGTRSASQLATAADVDGATAAAALTELRALCLLEADDGALGDTRRSMLRKAVVAGAAAGVGGTLISSVLLPTPAQAYDSQPGNGGGNGNGGGMGNGNGGGNGGGNGNGNGGGNGNGNGGGHGHKAASKRKTTKKRKPANKRHKSAHKRKHRRHTTRHHVEHHAKKKRHGKAHRRKRRHG